MGRYFNIKYIRYLKLNLYQQIKYYKFSPIYLKNNHSTLRIVVAGIKLKPLSTHLKSMTE